MKKILSVIILLSCIASSIFALSARVVENNSLFARVVEKCSLENNPPMCGPTTKSIIVYNDKNEVVLVYSRTLITRMYSYLSLRSLYTITWCKPRATVEQIKEWKEFARLFIEE